MNFSDCPFSLILENKTNLVCTQLLSHWPHKRAVFIALWQEQKVLIKLFFKKNQAGLQLKREQKGIELLQKANIAAPKVLYFETKQPDFALILYEYLEAPNLRQVFENSSNEKKELLMKHLLDNINLQHQHRIIQKDCHFANFLWHENKIVCIDGSRIMRHPKFKPLSKKAKISYLAKLVIRNKQSFYLDPDNILVSYAKTLSWHLKQKHKRFFKRAINYHERNQARLVYIKTLKQQEYKRHHYWWKRSTSALMNRFSKRRNTFNKEY